MSDGLSDSKHIYQDNYWTRWRANNRSLDKKRKAAIKARGCTRCRGELGEGSYCYSVALVHPCSEGSMQTAYPVCSDCYRAVVGLLKDKGEEL